MIKKNDLIYQKQIQDKYARGNRRNKKFLNRERNLFTHSTSRSNLSNQLNSEQRSELLLKKVLDLKKSYGSDFISRSGPCFVCDNFTWNVDKICRRHFVLRNDNLIPSFLAWSDRYSPTNSRTDISAPVFVTISNDDSSGSFN